MSKMASILLTGLAIIVVAGIGFWVWLGPQWRSFLSNPPSDTDVLFWEQSQRDTGFALGEKIPTVKSLPIQSAGNPRVLDIAEGLAQSDEIAAFMRAQNAAGLVILRDGKIVFEGYGLHQTKTSKWASFSVAKSMTSTLVGAAITDGHIDGLEAPISDYITAFQGTAYDGVTVQQLLTMTSGVDWNEDYDDPNSDVALFRAVDIEPGEASTVTYMKRLGRAHSPGDVFNYSTGETNLVGNLVEAATGKPLNAYLSEKIWGPYGMHGDAAWITASTGEPIGGCCIQASTRDYALFGQFVLDGGMIDGASIVPEGWFEAATSLQERVPDDDKRDYGFQWWILEDGSFAALGIFGQAIYVDRPQNIVMAINASWDDAEGVAAGQSDSRHAFWFQLRDWLVK
ncbi:MAG: serine hydrolase [Pseudomonadota bacterium]